MKRTIAAALLISLGLTACGSTVQVSSTRTVDGAPGLGEASSLGGPASSTATGPTSAGSAEGSSASGQAPSVAGGGTAGRPGSSSSPAATAVGGPGSSPARVGGALKPITIGVVTQQQLETAAKSFGLDGVTTGDTRKQLDAVLNWVKTHGGFGGRGANVVQYDANLSAGSNDAVMTQACTAFTQDNHVDYALTVLAGVKVLADCLHKAGAGLLADNSNFADSTNALYASTLGDPSELGLGRMQDLLIDHLWATGWLNAKSKVGVLAQDNHDGHEVVDGPLTHALKRHGLTSLNRFIDSSQGDGGSSASGNAVLSFRSAGVDRVIPAGYSPLYFMIAAENQGYRPAYAMVSANGPGALLEGLAPSNQLKNAQGIGWQPYLDIGKGTKPGPVSARETLCFDIMRRAGQAATSALVKGFQAQVCDLVFYLKDLADLRQDLSRGLLGAARVELGAHYISPATFRVDVTKRTAGMAAFRPLAFEDDCSCFQYVGPVQAAP